MRVTTQIRIHAAVYCRKLVDRAQDVPDRYRHDLKFPRFVGVGRARPVSDLPELMEVVGVLIERCEDQHVPELDG